MYVVACEDKNGKRKEFCSFEIIRLEAYSYASYGNLAVNGSRFDGEVRHPVPRHQGTL